MAIITKQISRRTFLGGTAVAIGLPFLESLTARTANAAGGPRKRFIAYYVPCGIHMKAWKPQATGRGSEWQLSQTLRPLSPVKNKLLVLSGLANMPGSRPGADHAAGTSAFLTAHHIDEKTSGFPLGISLDQLIAKKIKETSPTAIPSLQLGIDGTAFKDGPFETRYSTNISWASPTQPLSKVVNPQALFNMLFEGSDTTQTDGEKLRRIKYQKSVIDYVKGDIQELTPKLGNTDRAKLDEYLSGVRELELRVAASEDTPTQTQGNCAKPTAPPASADTQQQIDLITDLLVTALQCDQTRVASFMLGNGLSRRSHGFVNVPNDGGSGDMGYAKADNAHHPTSHHGNLTSSLQQLNTIDRWEVAQLAKLLTKLDAIDEGGSTVLDNTIVYFSSEISDGNAHTHYDMPVLIAGGKDYFDLGRHVSYPFSTSSGGLDKSKAYAKVGNLFMSILDAFDIHQTKFGDDGTQLLEKVKKA